MSDSHNLEITPIVFRHLHQTVTWDNEKQKLDINKSLGINITFILQFCLLSITCWKNKSCELKNYSLP